MPVLLRTAEGSDCDEACHDPPSSGRGIAVLPPPAIALVSADRGVESESKGPRLSAANSTPWSPGVDCDTTAPRNLVKVEPRLGRARQSWSTTGFRSEPAGPRGRPGIGLRSRPRMRRRQRRSRRSRAHARGRRSWSISMRRGSRSSPARLAQLVFPAAAARRRGRVEFRPVAPPRGQPRRPGDGCCRVRPGSPLERGHLRHRDRRT